MVEFQHDRIIVANMIRLTGNQAIAFEIGADAEFVDLGIVGHAILSCRNVRDAIQLWAGYNNALFGMLVRIAVEENHSRHSAITIAEAVPIGFFV